MNVEQQREMLNVLTNKTIITNYFGGIFCVMLGHLILDITSENVADNSSDPKDNLSVAIKN